MILKIYDFNHMKFKYCLMTNPEELQIYIIFKKQTKLTSKKDLITDEYYVFLY